MNEHGRIIEYELEDGVIINKEEVALVGCLKLSFLMSIMKHLRNIKTMNSYWIFVSSSRDPANDPALFESTVKSIKNFKTTMSIVFECHIYTFTSTVC